MIQHTISTTHIQRLILNAQMLTEALHEQKATHVYTPDGNSMERPFDEVAIFLPLGMARSHVNSRMLPEHVLEKAISDLRHAADELDAERLSCYGWKQV